jgi:hypothetical protein
LELDLGERLVSSSAIGALAVVKSDNSVGSRTLWAYGLTARSLTLMITTADAEKALSGK